MTGSRPLNEFEIQATFRPTQKLYPCLNPLQNKQERNTENNSKG